MRHTNYQLSNFAKTRDTKRRVLRGSDKTLSQDLRIKIHAPCKQRSKRNLNHVFRKSGARNSETTPSYVQNGFGSETANGDKE